MNEILLKGRNARLDILSRNIVNLEALRAGVLRRAFAPHQLCRLMADSAAWVVALTLASLLRVDFDLSGLSIGGQFAIIPVLVACHLVGAWITGLYAGRSRAGSFDEVAALARTVAITTPLVFAIDLIASDPRMVPLSAPVGAGFGAFVLMGAIRYLARATRDRARRPSGADVQRLVVFGAGEGGAQVVGAMLRDPTSAYLPVALLDDDPARSRLSINGVHVMGTRSDVARVARETAATVVLIAIPSASRELVGEVTDSARAAHLDVKVLPANRDLFDGGVGLHDIRDVTVADLLGRREIETSLESIAGYLTGKRVLVTGAGGSIGSELCRQIHRFAPEQLLMLDRDESALHAVQLSIEGRALLDRPELILADLRDKESITNLVDQWRPQVIFHAAALKHLTLLEQHPAEAVRTNVLATEQLLALAEATGVERFVNISTDKAADPVSVLGYSKRIAERLTADTASRAAGVFLSVRFGNVLGSRGSVLETFDAQIEAGGPLTVTHPNVRRYFMTTAEAVELVIQAGAIGRPGEVLVLDMGAPVLIAELAGRLAGLADRRLDIVFTGLRPGEKVAEVLFGVDEVDTRGAHPMIAHVAVLPLAVAELEGLNLRAARQDLIHELQTLCMTGERRHPVISES